MTNEELNRLTRINDYLKEWDFDMVPSFLINKKDAAVLTRVIDMYIHDLEYRREQNATARIKERYKNG